MKVYERRNGFTIVEILVVMSVMVIVLAIGSSFLSSMSVLRRSVDETTNNISSLLHIGKLRSARDGVEYRVVFERCGNVNDSDADCPVCASLGSYEGYQEGDDTLTVTFERGDSNRGSTMWCIESSHTRKFRGDLVFAASDNMGDEENPVSFTFLPSGMRRDFLDDTEDEVITISPTNDSRIDKCGVITVSPSGNISVNEGKWVDPACNPIRDSSAAPSPAPTG
ncbi:MAG: type II secretion system GspH family protein [Candidatus Dadabacteria bacterium]|nr:type II secretion system GspH family protein [Candidatus Dadabacteria bacterium]